MQLDINQIMGKVLQTVAGSREATVWIARPLQAGIQIEAEVRSADGRQEYVIVENDDDFMSYVESFKAQAPWNRMTIHLDQNGEVAVETSFDKQLEDDAMEKTK